MHNYGHWKKTLALLVMSALSLGASSVDAMPEGGVVRSGSGSVTQNGKEMTIRQDSGRLAMDWTGFSVGKDETVRFQQPGKDALALNRVTGNQQSVIDGSLLSNGHVLLVNPNGVVIGKNASIDVGGLVASTAQVKDNFMKEFGNSTGAFSLGGVSDGKIINEGTIKAEGGLVALHAAKVENSGTISNTGGSAVLAAADTLTLTPDADGKLNFTVDGKTAEASALNKGAITADGGTIVMTADSASDVMSTVVNNSGTLQARTLRKNEKGQILLDGGDKGQVEVSGTLDASGMKDGQSAGNIKVIGEKTIVHDGTNLLARGNVDGGKIETSGDVLNLGDNLNIDASGNRGSHGTWLLDPLEVVISATKPSSADHNYGTIVGDTNGKTKNNVIYNDPPSGQNANNSYNSTTWIDSNQVGNILSNGTDVMIQAISSSGAASITLESPIDITVSSSASKNPTFTLEANRNITINQNITAKSGGKGLNIMLNADTDGDNIGAVIMNADVTTNGGWFKSATGGNVTHTYGTSDADKKNYGTYNGVKVGGGPKHGPKHDGSTVGTYFGGKDTAKQAENRFIKTNGGAITLNGEVAIGLNGGTLNLETNGGALTVTGIVNSGNSYDYYYYDADTDTWNKTSDDAVIKKINGYVDKVLNGTEGVPMYEYKGINYSKDKDGNLTWTYDAVYYPDATNGNALHYVFRPLSTEEADEADQFITNNTNNNRDKEDTTNFSHTLTTSNPKWYLTKKAGWGFNSFIVRGKSSMTIDAFLTYLKNTYGNKNNFNSRYPHGTKYSAFTDAEKVNLRKDITSYLAHNWYVAQEMASTGSKGNGDQVGDSYLATITTRLENSLTTPNGAHIMWAGGRGSGVRNRNKKNDAYNVVTWYPADPTHPDGFYWVTGPEGLATDNASTYNDTAIGTGTKFWDTSSTDVQKDSNNYGQSVFGEAHWSTNLVGHQPDDNGPFLTVGYGSDNQWDDANFGGETTVGFVRETNSANSSLKINTGNGAVNLQGNIGGSQKLDTVTVNTTGDVTTGGSKITDYNMGTIHADHGVTIKGQNVTIGGRISSGASTETVNTDSSVVTDNVTITAARDITVHGITADGKTDENGKVTNGGKIKLTSTADNGVDNGVIKLESTANSNKNDYTVGNNKHEGDKEKDDGTLIAGSTENGAVIVDAQGKTGAFINETQGSSAITTGVVKDENGKVNKEGTWQVYVASPSDYDTKLGDNLNSKTNAQWSSESTRKSTTDEFDINAAGHNIGTYTDTSSNKFIFQVTPVITISGGNQQKTYGDTLDEDQLRNLLSTSATYKDSTGKDVDVTQFSNFNEADYLIYVTSSDGNKTGKDAVAVSSGGAEPGATRTNGDEDKKASDGNKAFYVFNVEKNGAKALNGYDLNTINGDIEILRKTLTINTDATQTYGKADVTSRTTKDYSTQLVNGDTLNAGDITYTIATKGTYATSKGSNTTAHKGIYENQYLTSGAGVKGSDGSDASANYEVTGSGTITVNPANLYLTVGDVSTTYGTAFDTDQYTYKIDEKEGGLVNGDTPDSVLGDQFLSYTNTGAKTDASNDKVKTQNAGTYELQGAVSKDKELSDYTVHITNGKSTVEKAKLTLTVGDTSTTYGTSDWTPYSYTLSGNTNGDSEDNVRNNQIEVSYSNGGEKSDPNNSAVKTQNAGDYGLTGTFTLKGDTAKNYEIDEVNSDLTGKATVKKATVKVKLNDVSTTYGTAFETKEYGYNANTIEGLTNGDVSDVVTSALKGTYGTGDITYTNTGDASTEEKQAGKVTKTVNGGPYYLEGTTDKTLKNYNIEIENGNATIKKATLHLSTGDYTETYGDVGEVQKDLDSATRVMGEKNGDDLADLVSEIGIHNTSGALLSDTRTNDVKYKADGSLDSYDITTDFKNSLDNYDVVQDKAGSVTLNPKEITIKNTMTQKYGSSDRIYKEATVPEGQLANGDTIFTKDLKFDIKADGEYAKSLADNKKNSSEAVTADAGTYTGELIHTGGGIIHKDGTDAYKNYKVTVEGDIIVNPKDITTRANGTGSTLDNLSWDVKNDSLANGDVWGKDVLFDKTYGDMISYADRTFGVKSFIDGKQISDGTQIGNYIYHPTGIVQLTFNPIVKPDVWAHSGGYRPRNKIETFLPVFRVEDAKVGQYGTYGVEHNEEGDRLVLSATGMRLPEPDQVPDEERTFTTTLSTETGSGTFKLVYNGVSLKVYPQDKEAEEMVRAGDKTKNVSLSEKALYVGYTEMGLDLIDLKGVYIYFN
ncbi:two-partner secretion domain-containing protein [Dialister succinatiphilus]|uniref:Filamentous hemagglutinin family domain-containing protein n=1 Tax=Dialister succinatiphilus YIT 11850 TaxID=742743 RepID=H1CXT5_9FIRM|nr:filamentous hemagglutinin N-terminal domain-containing protein [Dialister succinatiphilus]EHO63895.1 filamentous hemagglutinin family domain-containing protein [Dialister succinatiphilus YIT 11850]